MLQPDQPIEFTPKNLTAEELAKVNALSGLIAAKQEELQDFLEQLREPYQLPPEVRFSVNNWTGRITLLPQIQPQEGTR